MELFLDVKPVGKGDKGRTACGSSAYRACDKIIDNAGNEHNFTKKEGHVAGGVVLPEGAPRELLDRQTLWQRHDQKEIRKDAQIFREVEVALHNSLNYAAAERVCVKLSRLCAGMGMCVQWDIHDKTNKEGIRNLHAHLMLSMRELLPDGTFGKKNRFWNKFNGGLNLADALRPFTADLMNEELAKIGVEDKVEYKSFADRGIDRIPTVHIGVAARALQEEHDNITYKIKLNKKIREINAEHSSYVEKLAKYQMARAEFTREALQRAEDRHLSFDEMIQAADKQRPENEPLPGAREEIYKSIREMNRQAAEARKDSKRVKNIRQALYIVKNLAGDNNLTEEQEGMLNWAFGYLKWAGVEDLSPEGVEKAIEEYREFNTNCHVQQFEILKAKTQAYDDLMTLRTLEKPKAKPPVWRQIDHER